MLLSQLLWQGTNASWPAPAVHDTVAAIAREAEYQRSLQTKLWRQLWNWFDRLLSGFFDQFRGSATGRIVTIALVVLLVALIVARFVVAVRAAREEAEAGDLRVRRAGASDPWNDAERFASAGRFTEAAHALFAALLSAFASRGEVRLHASKTAGDYARELRRRDSPAQSGFQAFRRRYDRVIYGQGECNAVDYAALLHDAQPLLAHSRAA
jgi:hypothetical protein